MKKILFLTFLILSSCTPSQKKIENMPQLLDQADQASIQSHFLSYLKKYETISSFQGLAEIKLKTRGRFYSANEVVQIEFPQRFSLETLDDLGNLIFLLKSNGEYLLLQDVQASKKQKEKLSPQLIRQFLPFQSNIENTLGLLFGKVVLPSQASELRFERKSENPSQVWINYQNTRYLWDSQLKRVTLLEEYKKKKLIFRYEASDFKMLNEKNIVFPHKIWLKDFARGSEMGIHYSQMEINVKYEDAAFEITP